MATKKKTNATIFDSFRLKEKLQAIAAQVPGYYSTQKARDAADSTKYK